MMVVFLFIKELSEEHLHSALKTVKDKYREVFYVVLLVCIFVFGNFHSVPFIYFQF
jgi:hypothetical protein